MERIIQLAIDNANPLPYNADLVGCYNDQLTDEQVIEMERKHGHFIDNAQYIQRNYVILHDVAARVELADIREVLEAADFRKGQHLSDDDIIEALRDYADDDTTVFRDDGLDIYLEDVFYYTPVVY